MSIKDLTTQENKIAKLTACGYIAKEIADGLCISYHTVHTHLKNIRHKTGARNIADITRIYILSLENPKKVLKALLFLIIQLGIIINSFDFEVRRVNGRKTSANKYHRVIRTRANDLC